MKFIAIALLALVALTTVRSDTASEIGSCVSKLKIPCLASADAACATEFANYSKCLVNSNCAQKIETLSDYADCVRACKSTNAEVQTYIDGYADCINSNILSFAALILALFVAMF